MTLTTEKDDVFNHGKKVVIIDTFFQGRMTVEGYCTLLLAGVQTYGD